MLELTKTSAELQAHLASEKRQGDEVRGQLAAVRQELVDKARSVALTQSSLSEVGTQFEASIREMNGKADLLSSALDKEVELRTHAFEQVGVVSCKWVWFVYRTLCWNRTLF